MGMNLGSMSKILKCAANDDIITIKAQVGKLCFHVVIERRDSREKHPPPHVLKNEQTFLKNFSCLLYYTVYWKDLNLILWNLKITNKLQIGHVPLVFNSADPLELQDFGFQDPDPQKYVDPRIRIQEAKTANKTYSQNLNLKY